MLEFENSWLDLLTLLGELLYKIHVSKWNIVRSLDLLSQMSGLVRELNMWDSLLRTSTGFPGIVRNLESSFILTSQSWIQTVWTTQQGHHTVKCTKQQEGMHVARTVTACIPLVPYSSCLPCFHEVLRGAKKLLFSFGLYVSLVTILVEAQTL